MNSTNQTLGKGIEARKDELANLIVDEQWARNPQFKDHYGETGRAKCVQDVKYNLSYLSQAIASDSPPLFSTYIDWVNTLFQGLKIPTHELSESLEITGSILQQHFPDSATVSIIEHFIDIGLQHLRDAPQALASFLDESQPYSVLAQKYLETLRHGERSSASHLILDVIEQGMPIKDVYLKVFQPSQYEIGRLWQTNQISVAEEHYCTAATQLIMAQLYSKIFNTKKNGRRMVATCVGNELHEIGLHMVADFFEMEGWDTYYLGSNTPASSILRTLTERKPDVLAISATMTFHISLVTGLIEQVRAVAANRQIRILVGGYPFNVDPDLWRQVGADGFAANAEQAIFTANAMLEA
jgi:methanogenic corrinoid protein MtbC1